MSVLKTLNCPKFWVLTLTLRYHNARIPHFYPPNSTSEWDIHNLFHDCYTGVLHWLQKKSPLWLPRTFNSAIVASSSRTKIEMESTWRGSMESSLLALLQRVSYNMDFFLEKIELLVLKISLSKWGMRQISLETWLFFADLAETRIKSSGDFSLFKDNCDKKEPMEKSDHEGSCEPDLKRAKPFDV